MSATNATTYYELPVFIATDKPAWLTDWNGAMNAIDTAIKAALTAGENAQTTANTATTSISTINDSLTTINTSLTTLTSTVTGLVGSVNTINSLIGNGEPTTSDKTLIGAINEIYAMIGGGTEVDADIVAYDNTASGLTATNVQDAIDELATATPAVAYDFDLSAFTGNATLTSSIGSLQQASSNVTYELNADKSIAKFYGGIVVTTISGQTGEVTLANIASTDFPTRDSAMSVDLGYVPVQTSASAIAYRVGKLRFNTDGSLDFLVSLSADDTVVWATLPPCIYFI